MKHEVGSAISGFLHPANENIVRLAACSLARQIFLNIGSRISQLTDEIMRDLYRTLKTIAYDHLQNDDVRILRKTKLLVLIKFVSTKEE